VEQSGRQCERLDWLSLAVATALMQAVYVATMNPDIGLHNDGVCAASGMYGGVSMPAGFPVWTMWSWAWAKLPLCTVGWRISFGTALAASLTCGLVALMVSRAGAGVADGLRPAGLLRASAGVSAGAVFGLSGAFWRQSVIPDPWPMSVLLVALLLCLLARWSDRPNRRRFLYLAAWIYGATIAESRIQEALVPAIPFYIMLHDEKLGRDMFAVGAVLYFLAWCGAAPELSAKLEPPGCLPYLHTLGWIAILFAVALTFKTRHLFTAWKPLAFCALFFALGFFISFEVSLVSMTNPPVNWGYPRTPEGFFHVITRGQYDEVAMTPTILGLLAGMREYALAATTDFGWPCLVFAAIPFFWWRQWPQTERRRLVTLAAFVLCSTVLVVAALNPTPDLQTATLVKLYFTPSYLVLAILFGQGLLLAARRLLRPYFVV